MSYISVPIESNREILSQDAYEYIQSFFPNWSPNTGSLDVILVEAMATEASILRELASDVPASIFRWFGSTLLGLPPYDEVAATVPSTWAARDLSGHLVVAGTQVAARDAAGITYPFAVVGDVLIPEGSSTTDPGAVMLQALLPGAASSGLGTAGTPLELLDTLDWVLTVTQTEPTSGGADAEDDDVYLNRLSEHMRLLSTRPILPVDFEIMTRSVPGVWRAGALDGYNPANGTYGNERMITVYAIDQDGNNASPALEEQIDDLLEANREINFIVNIDRAARTAVDVTYDVKVLEQADPASTVIAIDNTLKSYLSPSTWGVTAENPREWDQVTHVRYLELAQVINNVEGVDYIVTLTVNGGTADINLPGAMPLATAGTISGTAS